MSTEEGSWRLCPRSGSGSHTRLPAQKLPTFSHPSAGLCRTKKLVQNLSRKLMEMTMNTLRKREGVTHVIPVSHRRTLERDRSTSAHGSSQAQGRPSSRARSQVSDGH